jgi:two-component sensor histidine kinase
VAKQDSLQGLLAELFEPYRRSDRQPIVITGDEIAIDDRSATPLALLFHELATNATKYGALSADDGVVDVSIARSDDHVVLRWAERQGPAVTEPTGPQGFGSQLIELSAVRQLGGIVERQWLAAGLVVTINVPLAAFSRS